MIDPLELQPVKVEISEGNRDHYKLLCSHVAHQKRTKKCAWAYV